MANNDKAEREDRDRLSSDTEMKQLTVSCSLSTQTVATDVP